MKTSDPSSHITMDFVESLQHDPKCTLLYGKNNVYIQTNDSNVRVPGYLSLHHNLNGQSVAKWTPNFLMNTKEEELDKIEKEGVKEAEEEEEESNSSEDENTPCEVEFSKSALAILVTDLKYIYCHQQPEGRGTIVIVSRQGQSWPPLNFHDRCHMMTFLSSLEKALLPTGQLDPPTSKYKRKWKSNSDNESTTENVSPSSHDSDVENVKLKQNSVDQSQADNDTRVENEATDFVFAINFTNTSSDVEDEADSLKKHPWPPNYTEEALSLRCKPSGTITKSTEKSKEMMRRRIMSCVFYQWLAYCRLMKSLRSYAVNFVLDKQQERKGFDYSLGLTEARFEDFLKEGSPESFMEFQRCIYFGGCEANIRQRAWCYLLKLVPWDGVQEFLDVKMSLERRYVEGCQSAEGQESLERIRSDVETFRQSHNDEPEEFFTTLITILRAYFSSNTHAVYSSNHCDTMAVLFRALEDEAVTFACFGETVGRSTTAKCKGNLDSNLVDLRSLIQLLDPELFEFMHENCDLSHIYFTQRWFLTEFTEEFSINEAAKVYETLWASETLVSSQFPLFIALSLIQQYRDGIIQQKMGFVDVRNLFNEKARTHDVERVLSVARRFAKDLQDLRQRNAL